VWWARSEARAHAWLGAGRVALRRPGEDLVIEASVSADEGIAWLLAALKGRSRAGGVHLWLASDLCELACMPAMTGVNRLEEAQAAAVAWLQAQGRLRPGWTASLVECTPTAAFWRMAQSPDGLVESVRQQLPVRSVRPWWSWALQHLNDRQRGFCAYDGAALVFCEWDDEGHVAAAETVGPMGDISGARRLLKRRSLQRPVQQVVAQVDWALSPGENDAGFAFAPWVRWGDAL
jgi:hypothetical protein